MKNNKRLFFGGLIIIGLLVVIGYIGSYALWLKEPVFLNHHIQKSVIKVDENHISEIDLELFYITNRMDNREVRYVSFPEYPEVYLQAHPNYFTNPNQNLGRYSLRSIRARLILNQLEGIMRDEVVEISEVKLHFSDGSFTKDQIGRISIVVDEDKMNIPWKVSSSDTVVTAEYQIEENMILLGIDYYQDEQSKDFFYIEINGKNYEDILGKEIKSDSRLRTRTVLGQPEKINDRFSYLFLDSRINVKNDKGEQGFLKLHPLIYRPHEIHFMDVMEYLRERRNNS